MTLQKKLRTLMMMSILILAIQTGSAATGTISQEKWVDYLQKENERMMGGP